MLTDAKRQKLFIKYFGKKYMTEQIKRKKIPIKCPYCGKLTYTMSKYGFCGTSCRLNALNLAKKIETIKLDEKTNKLRLEMIKLFNKISPKLQVLNKEVKNEKNTDEK